MDAAAIAEKQEADGLTGQAERDLPGISFAARGWGDRKDQSHSARLGEVLRDRSLESVLLVYPKLGRDEDSAPSGAGVPASRPWVETMEQGVALWDVGALLGVPRVLSLLRLCSRSTLIGPITLDVKCAGARSAGNPHATCDVAGAGKGDTAIPKRARRGKPGIQAKEEPTGHRASARPYRELGSRENPKSKPPVVQIVDRLMPIIEGNQTICSDMVTSRSVSCWAATL